MQQPCSHLYDHYKLQNVVLRHQGSRRPHAPWRLEGRKTAQHAVIGANCLYRLAVSTCRPDRVHDQRRQRGDTFRCLIAGRPPLSRPHSPRPSSMPLLSTSSLGARCRSQDGRTRSGRRQPQPSCRMPAFTMCMLRAQWSDSMQQAGHRQSCGVSWSHSSTTSCRLRGVASEQQWQQHPANQCKASEVCRSCADHATHQTLPGTCMTTTMTGAGERCMLDACADCVALLS